MSGARPTEEEETMLERNEERREYLDDPIKRLFNYCPDAHILISCKKLIFIPTNKLSSNHRGGATQQ
jgi:hypothetical protein